MQYPSHLIEDAVNAFARFPGIGRKTALRLTLHVLRQDAALAELLGNAVIKLKQQARFCQKCGNIADAHLCNICANPARDQTLVCIVEDLRDVIAIENTGQFHGTYHILNGLISPLDGIGPDQLNIESLVERATTGQISEMILALAANMEGDTTAFYIGKRLAGLPIRISSISRGIAVGGELEYADEITLGRSIVNRIPFGQQGVGHI